MTEYIIPFGQTKIGENDNVEQTQSEWDEGGTGRLIN